MLTQSDDKKVKVLLGAAGFLRETWLKRILSVMTMPRLQAALWSRSCAGKKSTSAITRVNPMCFQWLRIRDFQSARCCQTSVRTALPRRTAYTGVNRRVSQRPLSR